MALLDKEETALTELLKQYGEGVNEHFVRNVLEGVDWIALLNKAIRYKIFPYVYKSLYEYIPCMFKIEYENRYLEICKGNNIKLAELKRILETAGAEGIDITLIKGMVLSSIIYGDVNARQSKDIDLLVDEHDMDKLYSLIYKMGYRFNLGWDNEKQKYILADKPVFLYNDRFHEFQCIRIFGGGDCIHVEIKRASSAIPQEIIDDFKRNTVYVNMGKLRVKTLNQDYTLLHLFANFYTNFEVVDVPNLRDVLDVLSFIKKYGCYIKWDGIKRLADKYAITHKFYYVFNCIKQLARLDVSENSIKLFDPERVSYKFDGNVDGSANRWHIDLLTRIFREKERINDLIYLKKSTIYSDVRNAAYDVAADNRFADVFNIKNYRHVIVDSDIKLDFMVSGDGTNICFYLIFDPDCEKSGRYYISCGFVDNNLRGNVGHREIYIDSKSFKTNNLSASLKIMDLGDRRLMKINVDLNSFDMDWDSSDNTIYYWFWVRGCVTKYYIVNLACNKYLKLNFNKKSRIVQAARKVQ